MSGSGTFRFAWTQGVGRTRWAISTLVLLALLLTAVTGAFTALFWRYLRPFLADGQVSEFLPLAFGLLGGVRRLDAVRLALAAFTGDPLAPDDPGDGGHAYRLHRPRDAAATVIRPHYAAPVTGAGLESGRRDRLGDQQLGQGA